MTELTSLGAVRAATAIRTGSLAPSDLIEALLDRIDRLEPDIRAWARVAAVTARVEAGIMSAEACNGRLRGPLHGVPLAIKDNVDTGGIETNAGSTLLAGRVPDQDAPLVRRLRDAGAIILGKTSLTVFAAMDPAPTRNPWNLAHTPGGSSSGSAAAVAAGLAPGAVGSQTAGSIIRPAAYCGVVGLKPTYGAVDRAGVFPCAWSMDHLGPIARGIDDVALLFRVMADRDPAAPLPSEQTPSSGLRAGVPDRYFGDNIDRDTARAFDTALDALSSAGVGIETVRLPSGFEAGLDAGIITMYAEMAAVHEGRYTTSPEGYPWRLSCLLDAGRRVTATQYLGAQRVRRLANGEISTTLAKVDCLITPSTPAPAPRGLENTGDWSFNIPFSSSGHPALSIPVGLSAAGLPIGVQLVSRRNAEEQLFTLGAILERLLPMPICPIRNS